MITTTDKFIASSLSSVLNREELRQVRDLILLATVRLRRRDDAAWRSPRLVDRRIEVLASLSEAIAELATEFDPGEAFDAIVHSVPEGDDN
jgi:hypothetical protein